jgi:hypothetical protein
MLALLGAAVAGPARGETPADAAAPAPPLDEARGPDPDEEAADGEGASGRALPVAVAVVPGALVHGAGHLAAGDPDGARTLLFLEGVGLGAMALALATLVASGASRRIVAPAAAVGIAGSGLFFGSWFGDVYGTATPDRARGEPRTVLPAVEASLGYRHVVDPTFSYRSFLVSALDLRLGRVRLAPEGWFALGHANERVRGLVSYRVSGPLPASPRGEAPERARDGSFVDLEVAGVRHAFPPERFAMTQLELGVAGRLDLARVYRSLGGSFLEGSLGYALARHDYAAEGAPVDTFDQLLARWAYGVYVGGRDSSRRAEISLAYEHRHDGYAAGMKLTGLLSGVPGNAALRALAWLTPELGGLVDVQVGSAWVFGGSLLVRQAVLP